MGRPCFEKKIMGPLNICFNLTFAKTLAHPLQNCTKLNKLKTKKFRGLSPLRRIWQKVFGENVAFPERKKIIAPMTLP